MANKKEINQPMNVLFYVSIVLLIISLIIFSFNVIRVIKMTGYAVGTGSLNLTISSAAAINFTTNSINWGTGSVASGKTSATLNTAAGANNVSDGNWTGNTNGLVIENIGNQNVSLDIKAGKNANTFVGGTGSSYQWNFTNNEANSCTNSTPMDVFADVNITDPGTRVCDILGSGSADTLRIDIKLVIPSDATQTGTSIGDVITATATGV